MTEGKDVLVKALQYPLVSTIGEGDNQRTETVSEITMRLRLKGKDMRAMDLHEGGVAKMLAVIARLTGLTFAQVDAMDAEDLQPLMDIVDGFTKPGRPTGNTSSAS